jgi:hypothetical protein
MKFSGPSSCAWFFPFQTTYYLNEHSFIEQELNRQTSAFARTTTPSWLSRIVEALQAAADKLSPAVIRERLDYWTFILGPKFSDKERKKINLSRFYSISQIEYCSNFIFKRHFPIHKIFERSYDLALWRLTANKISEIFGHRLHRKIQQARDRHRPDLAWSSRLSRLVQARLPEAIREVLHIPA